jgi:hypothetical protein
MGSLSDQIPIPNHDTINVGLSSASEQTMVNKLGVPGLLTKDCSAAAGDFKKRLISNADVGPFKVTGLDFAVESLRQVFADAKIAMPEVYKQVKTAGMFCVRARRHSPTAFSNHSWGTAIDLFFGTTVVPQGVGKSHRGIVLLFPLFNKHGWYWGAGFSGAAIDTMHFEIAEERIVDLVNNNQGS